jgi:hypothetical protein
MLSVLSVLVLACISEFSLQVLLDKRPLSIPLLLPINLIMILHLFPAPRVRDTMSSVSAPACISEFFHQVLLKPSGLAPT